MVLTIKCVCLACCVSALVLVLACASVLVLAFRLTELHILGTQGSADKGKPLVRCMFVAVRSCALEKKEP